MTIVINRKNEYNVDVIAGFHRGITFSISEAEDGGVNISWARDSTSGVADRQRINIKPIKDEEDEKNPRLV